ncbi:hypothetical protein ON010_g14655 [Phytophthora cinnamomi]|nr:hypothetical protein ON010_g14655 [Phytophthora cinnamomi]
MRPTRSTGLSGDLAHAQTQDDEQEAAAQHQEDDREQAGRGRSDPPDASPDFELQKSDEVSELQNVNIVSDLDDANSVLTIDSSIHELLTTIQTSNDARCEQALFLLLEVSIDDQLLKSLGEEDGIFCLVVVLREAVRAQVFKLDIKLIPTPRVRRTAGKCSQCHKL